MKNLIVFVPSLLILILSGFSHAETKIESVVKTIVRDRDSNDNKVYKIEKWVRDNIEYHSDKKQFNMNERWTMPMETLQRRKGDCEDGSILIMSFAVTAGVPKDRLRLYAPIVTSKGYHASVAYRRESDDNWVWVEWTTQKAHSLGRIDKRPVMEEINSFLPLGYFLEVKSLNPYNMIWLEDTKWRERSTEFLKNQKQ